VSGSVVILTTAAVAPLTLVLPAFLTYRQRTYQLVVTARQKLELRAWDPAEVPMAEILDSADGRAL
jgi:hypothetical protein